MRKNNIYIIRVSIYKAEGTEVVKTDPLEKDASAAAFEVSAVQ